MSKLKKCNEQQIDEIVKSIDQHVANCAKAKKILFQWADDLGFQEELGREQRELWNGLRLSDDYPSIAASGIIISQEMSYLSDRILDSTENSPIASLVSVSNTASVSLASTAISGVALSYQQDEYPPSYNQVTRIIEQRNDNHVIANRLREVDVSLADEYENAWKALHTTSSDETRSPMFLIREVINRLFHFYAPSNEVKERFALDDEEEITRSQRLQFMASKIDPLRKNAFLKEERAFSDIYHDLSYAHKHGNLDLEKSRGFLYQANELIKLLLDSFSRD